MISFVFENISQVDNFIEETYKMKTSIFFMIHYIHKIPYINPSLKEYMHHVLSISLSSSTSICSPIFSLTSLSDASFLYPCFLENTPNGIILNVASCLSSNFCNEPHPLDF